MAQDLFITKKRIGRPPGKTKPQTKPVQVPIESIAALDAWIAAQPEPRPTRPEAIRRLLAEALGKTVGADVKSPALPPASDAFLRALGHG